MPAHQSAHAPALPAYAAGLAELRAACDLEGVAVCARRNDAGACGLELRRRQGPIGVFPAPDNLLLPAECALAHLLLQSERVASAAGDVARWAGEAGFGSASAPRTVDVAARIEREFARETRIHEALQQILGESYQALAVIARRLAAGV